MENIINFSCNWNLKLCCQTFTTIRLGKKLQVGDIVMIRIKGKNRGLAEVIMKRDLMMSEITDEIAYLDTGYDAESTKKIFLKMYKDTDFEKVPLTIFFLRYMRGDNLPCIEQSQALKEIREDLE